MSDAPSLFEQAKARGQFLLKRRSHYRAVFQTQSGKQVLADLKNFAKANESPLMVSPVSRAVDPIATAVRIGRQEMYQRIVAQLLIDDRDLYNLKEDQQ